MLFPLPIAVDVAREAVRAEMSYGTTEAAPAAPRRTAPAVRRSRQLLAAGLHRLAEAVAPADRPRHYGTAH